MMSTYPPDNITVLGTDVVWGTDLDKNTSVFLSGDSSVEIKNTTPTGDPGIATGYFPCEEGLPYLCRAVVRATSIAAGNTISAAIQWHEADKSYISGEYLHNAVLGAADTWTDLSIVSVAPSTARYGYLYLLKNNTAFTTYVDHLSAGVTQRSFLAFLDTSAQTVNDTATDKILFNAELYDYGGLFDAVTDNTFTVPRTGVYSLSAMLAVDGLDDGDELALIWYKNTSGWQYGDFKTAYVTGNPLALTSSLSAVYLQAGDAIDVRLAYDNQGGAGSCSVMCEAGGITFSYFSATEWL